MSILTEPKKWQRKRSSFAQHRRYRAILTPEQQANVRRALRKLVRLYGSFAKLCAAMGMSIDGLMKADESAQPERATVAKAGTHRRARCRLHRRRNLERDLATAGSVVRAARVRTVRTGFGWARAQVTYVPARLGSCGRNDERRGPCGARRSR